MSIVRQARRCCANQDLYKALNAFVVPGKDILSKVEEVGVRLHHGQSPSESFKATTSHAHALAESPKSGIDGQLIAVKDNICTTEERTTCASAILNGFTSPYAATVVKKIEQAGAIVAGKTNMDEFGMGYAHTRSALL